MQRGWAQSFLVEKECEEAGHTGREWHGEVVAAACETWQGQAKHPLNRQAAFRTDSRSILLAVFSQPEADKCIDVMGQLIKALNATTNDELVKVTEDPHMLLNSGSTCMQLVE